MTATTKTAAAARVAHPLRMPDGATADLTFYLPAGPIRAALLWVPAMGVGARHYELVAAAFAARGIAVAVHEWRGIGSSNHRASRRVDWGYRQLLLDDLPASLAALRERFTGVPVYLGGHSLGGQLACLFAATIIQPLAGLLLVASGAPYWRCFKPWVGLAYVAAPLLARLKGAFPGRRIGFGGNEARGVIADWARTGRTGRYAARGYHENLEFALARVQVPVLAMRLHDDWMAPSSSLVYLLDKMPDAPRDVVVLSADDLSGMRADHFSWMKMPDVVARAMDAWVAKREEAVPGQPHAAP